MNLLVLSESGTVQCVCYKNILRQQFRCAWYLSTHRLLSRGKWIEKYTTWSSPLWISRDATNGKITGACLWSTL